MKANINHDIIKVDTLNHQLSVELCITSETVYNTRYIF